uniref:Protein kinase domain-containing protein n=1 Tax=Meloidogyne hapla TaxID=6305 RepID=A0A1I8BFU9_MELHA
MYIVLELGGKNLKQYFHDRIVTEGGIVNGRTNEKLLIKIVKGAARTLEQFHQYGIHGDVKYDNFVVAHENDSNDDVIDVKLIDFNNSCIHEIPEMSNSSG